VKVKFLNSRVPEEEVAAGDLARHLLGVLKGHNGSGMVIGRQAPAARAGAEDGGEEPAEAVEAERWGRDRRRRDRR
jgi:hypothetical protein